MSDLPEIGACETSVLPIQSFVNSKHVNLPLTGTYALETKIPGWSWDQRLLENTDVPRTLYTGRTGGFSHNLLEGTVKDDWVSGSIIGVSFEDIIGFKYLNTQVTWTPRVTTGRYSISSKQKNLYSDYAVATSTALDPDENTYGCFLRPDAALDTLSVTMFKRDSGFINWPYESYSYAESFSGEMIEEPISSNSLEFTSNGDIVSLGDLEDLTFNDGLGTDRPFSISAWVRIDNVNGSAGAFFSKRHKDNDEGEYYFGHQGGELIAILYADGDRNGVGSFNTMNRINVRVPPGHIQDNTWHHIVITYDGSKDSAGLSIYVDGSFKTPSESSSLNYEGMGNEDAAACIGGTENPETNVFEDYISDVVVFDKELKYWEVTEIYNNNSVLNMHNFSDYSSVVSWYKMGGEEDEFSDDPAWIPFENVRDYVGSNHGTSLGDVSVSNESPPSGLWVYRKTTTTEAGENIIENFSKRKFEFKLKDFNSESGGKLLLNRYESKKVGNIPENEVPPYSVLDCLLEYKGTGNSKGRDCYTNYFPLKEDSVRVFVAEPIGDNDDGEVIEWTQVDNFSNSGPGDNHYKVDHDLGIITMSGYKAPDVYLKETLLDDGNQMVPEIKAIGEPGHLNSYRPSGTFLLGDETITYDGLSYDGFLNCVRSQPNTLWDLGTRIQDVKNGNGAQESSSIYIAYEAIPRAEYELTTADSSLRSMNRAPFIDVKAIRNTDATGILQINPAETHVAKLTLTSDSPPLGGNIHGPVYYGTDHSRLVATATDTRGNPQEDIEVTFVLESEVGAINGFVENYTDATNTVGEAYAIYNVPYTWESVSKDVIEIQHEGNDSKIIISQNPSEAIPPGVLSQDVTVFQVFKHDKSMAAVGSSYNVVSLGFHGGNHTLVISEVFDDPATRWESQQARSEQFAYQAPTHYLSDKEADPIGPGCGESNEREARWGSAYADISFQIAGEEGLTVVRRRIIQATNHFNEEKELVGTAFVLSRGFPDALINAEIVGCRLIEKDMRVWRDSTNRHLSVVMYEWSENATHPLTGQEGAYTPLRPTSVSPNELLFEGRLLPIPSLTDKENNLAKYLVVAPDMVSLYAYCKDPVSGRHITSNRVRLRLDLPAYLTGVDKSGALPVPYGFGFVTEDFNLGAGLGGSNFLTINPSSEGIDRFNLNINMNTE